MSYLGMFTDRESLMYNFRITDKDLEGCKILFAAYEDAGYDGYALVIFSKDGKLYEVNGSHCSCNGLEDQWTPEETTFEALKIRNYNHGDLQVDLEKFLIDLVFEKEVLEN